MTDKWSGLAVLLANLIEKYAGDLDIENMPGPVIKEAGKNTAEKDKKNYDFDESDVAYGKAA